jgi:nitrous oxidase accessory protein
VEDPAPLSDPPGLPEVPRSSDSGGGASAAGLAGSAALVAAGSVLLLRGRP